VIIFNLAISELHYRCSFYYSELHKCYVNDQNFNSAMFGWLVAVGWCWFVLREEYCCLVAGGCFVVREKYCWLVADKPSEVLLSIFEMIRLPLSFLTCTN
jgi:hypothetical protein